MTEPKNFNDIALNWDEEPRRVKLAYDVATAITAAITILPEWDAADIGCGTGLVTLQLAPLFRSITGVDNSGGMLDRLSAKVQQSGISNVRTELCNLAVGELPAGTFNVVTSAMMLHHINDVKSLLILLKRILRPGGWIALADLSAEDGSFHDDPTGVFHLGFRENELTEWLESCGYATISVTAAATITKGINKYPVLLAVAQLH
ncbi:MAG: class I SAM-dependent methyltransferase [Desulfuromonadaceae bacterium]|nr:class I SAM-dependent methyltransferase [Desulfuromonadaceae bacterium]